MLCCFGYDSALIWLFSSCFLLFSRHPVGSVLHGLIPNSTTSGIFIIESIQLDGLWCLVKQV
uniref:Uncharacterized protein n=1 Tax=Arundo donax TaxID=35708 RepID=A0A0A9DEX8_ARUDO